MPSGLPSARHSSPTRAASVRSDKCVAIGVVRRSTARSVISSAPSTAASCNGPCGVDARIVAPHPSTTCQLLTTWPESSTTNPEPDTSPSSVLPDNATTFGSTSATSAASSSLSSSSFVRAGTLGLDLGLAFGRRAVVRKPRLAAELVLQLVVVRVGDPPHAVQRKVERVLVDRVGDHVHRSDH